MRPQEFSYLRATRYPKFLKGLPYLTFSLQNQERSVSVSALIDSGSSISILPFDVGIALGLNWHAQHFPLPPLLGNLQPLSVFAVSLEAFIHPFPQVSLVFAWISDNSVPVILGQNNFFDEFNVSFFGSDGVFQLIPK